MSKELSIIAIKFIFYKPRDHGLFYIALVNPRSYRYNYTSYLKKNTILMKTIHYSHKIRSHLVIMFNDGNVCKCM